MFIFYTCGRLKIGFRSFKNSVRKRFLNLLEAAYLRLGKAVVKRNKLSSGHTHIHTQTHTHTNSRPTTLHGPKVVGIEDVSSSVLTAAVYDT